MLKCPLHYFTGYDCPFCGMQRAFVAVMHGEVWEAFMLNPVVWILMPYFGLLVACQISKRIRDSRLGIWSMKNRTIFSVVAILAIWGIFRNIFL